jgi:hypothetical protein
MVESAEPPAVPWPQNGHASAARATPIATATTAMAVRHRLHLTNTRACGPNREQFCFCDPNGKVACESCATTDAGAGTDAGTLKMCPANATMRTATCNMNGERCAAGACTNMKQDVCICAVLGGAATGRWFCNTIACQ